MMENWPPLTSPDGSSNRNTPERCPRPLYSRDSIQEHHRISRHYQGKNLITVKEEAEEMYVTDDEQWKEGKVPAEISTDGSSNINTPDGCPSPLYSRDYAHEHHNIPQDDQCWDFQAAAFSSNAGPSGTARSSRGRSQIRSQPSRKQNLTWSVLENSVLVTHTVPHYPKLCGTQGRYLYPYQKKQIWQQIAVAVNAVSRQHRDWKHCRRKLTDIRRAILRKHREHHNASLQTGGGPSRELILLDYESELMTVLQEEIFSGLGGDYDLDLPEDAAAGSPHASNGGHDARFSSIDNTVLFYSDHEEEAEEEIEEKVVGLSHDKKPTQAGGAPSPEETSTLHSEAVKPEMAPALLWTGPSSLPRRPQPVSPLVHSPSAVMPEASTIPVAFSPKAEKVESPPPPTCAAPSPQPYRERQQLELQRQQLLAHRRTHRVMEVQVRQQRRHYMAVERSLNALVQQQRALTQEMAGIHSVLRQAVTIMGQGPLHVGPVERRQQMEQVHASSPAATGRTHRGRPRGANRSRPC